MPSAHGQNKSAPEISGALHSWFGQALRRRLGVDHLRLAAADRNAARLHRLGDLADEVDVQETVLERRRADLDMVGELEHALERTRRDALVEHLALVVLGLRLLLALDRQHTLLGLD